MDDNVVILPIETELYRRSETVCLCPFPDGDLEGRKVWSAGCKIHGIQSYHVARRGNAVATLSLRRRRSGGLGE
jgi:hypothetical protein